jgi:uncharacterized protein YndB with AHSA1/START domain
VVVQSHVQEQTPVPETIRLKMIQNTTPIQGVTHETLVFEREIPAPVVDVFSAYADARVRAAWSVASNDIHGNTHYLEIVPNQRIVSSETLSTHGMRLAISLITIEFSDLGKATRLKCTIQIASFVGQDMIRGYEDGNNGALNGLVRHFE